MVRMSRPVFPSRIRHAGGSRSLCQNGDLGPVGAKGQHVRPPGPALDDPTASQIVIKNLARAAHDDSAAVRAEGRCPINRACKLQKSARLFHVPYGQANFGRLHERQVAAVGAEVESPNVVVRGGLESGDLLVVGAAADRDAAVAESESVPCHLRIESRRDCIGRPSDDPTGGLQVGERHASDRQVAQRVAA